MDTNNLVQESPWLQERLATLMPNEEWQPDVSVSLRKFRELQVQRSFFGKRWMFAVATAAIAGLCLLALPSPKVFAHRCIECTVAVWHSLAPSASVQENLRPPSERTPAPDFNLKDDNGADFKLSGLKNKVVLVNFWATWCGGCQEEIPCLIEFQKEYGDQGLVVVGISMDDDGWKSVRPWLKEKKVNYPIVIGNRELADKYKLVGMPLTALVDRQGRIADLRPGVVDKAGVQQKIKALLHEQIDVRNNAASGEPATGSWK
jgi:thiol-disulfide isomerase/thioredoxin